MIPFSSLWPYTPIKLHSDNPNDLAPVKDTYARDTVERPGSTPPKAYIANTRIILNKAIDKHTDELLALDKDIERLTEERRQCRIALDGMQAALTHMSAADISDNEPSDNPQWTEAELEAITTQGVQDALAPNKIK